MLVAVGAVVGRWRLRPVLHECLSEGVSLKMTCIAVKRQEGSAAFHMLPNYDFWEVIHPH